jgi:hypothetical protein
MLGHRSKKARSYTRTVTISRLIEVARQLGPDADGLAPDNCAEANPEYLRGIVNLITGAAGLTSDQSDLIINAVTQQQRTTEQVIDGIYLSLPRIPGSTRDRNGRKAG